MSAVKITNDYAIIRPNKLAPDINVEVISARRTIDADDLKVEVLMSVVSGISYDRYQFGVIISQ